MIVDCKESLRDLGGMDLVYGSYWRCSGDNIPGICSCIYSYIYSYMLVYDLEFSPLIPNHPW